MAATPEMIKNVSGVDILKVIEGVITEKSAAGKKQAAD
jgi:phage terminase large subunit-like protein